MASLLLLSSIPSLSLLNSPVPRTLPFKVFTSLGGLCFGELEFGGSLLSLEFAGGGRVYSLAAAFGINFLEVRGGGFFLGRVSGDAKQEILRPKSGRIRERTARF